MSNEQLKPISYYNRRLSDTELREMFDFPNNSGERPTPKTDAPATFEAVLVTWREAQDD